MIRRALGVLTLLAAAPIAQAHIASNGFLSLEVERAHITGALELAIRDGELAVGLDRDRDGKVSWGELRAAQSALQSYVGSHLRLLGAEGPCTLSVGAVQVNQRVDGAYLWLPIAGDCGREFARLRIDYSLLREEDPSHRGLLTLRAHAVVQTAVLGDTAGARAFDLDDPSPWEAIGEYLRAGVWHIWSGIDHLLFLLSLLLPAVLLREHGHWRPVPRARPAFMSILKIVTAFTLAHSLTLSLAAFDVVRLPSRLTESAIAASIIAAALNNVFPVFTESRARIAFAFGLLHGFGFASVLADMGLPHGARLLSLLAFNLGIETGQLAVVLLVMPAVYCFRKQLLYRRTVLPWGSAAIATLALVWLVQRAFFPS
jgi:hypothetical protein